MENIIHLRFTQYIVKNKDNTFPVRGYKRFFNCIKLETKKNICIVLQDHTGWFYREHLDREL